MVNSSRSNLLPVLYLGSITSALLLGACGGGGSSNQAPNENHGFTLTSNSFIFSQLDPTGQTYHVVSSPITGIGATSIATNVPISISLFSVNPSAAQIFVFAASVSPGLYGIYSNNSLSLQGAKTLVSPTYAGVVSISQSADGKSIVYTAYDQTGNSQLYVLTSGSAAPIAYDSSTGSSLSPANSDHIIYTKTTTLVGEVFERSLNAGASAAPVQLTNDQTVDKFAPTFNSDETLLAYQEDNLTTQEQNYAVQSASGSPTVLPNPSGLNLMSGAFMSAGAGIVFTGYDSSDVGHICQESIAPNAQPTDLVAPSSTILADHGVSFTASSGRGIGAGGVLGAILRHQSRALK